MGRNVNFVDKFTNQESVLHMGRNAISAKRTIIGKLLCDKDEDQQQESEGKVGHWCRG